MIVELGAVRAGDRPRVGGKAIGCALLIEAGLPVPRGVVITTDAFDRFFAPLSSRRREFYDAIQQSGDEPALRARAAALEAEVRRAALPEEVARALEEAVRRLTPPLAVRSSATAEDSPATAFAGVFHSELDVAGDRVAEAARACWAFAFDWGAITHALRNNVDPAQVRIALLVQEMVPATRAGVLFTRDPSGAHPDEAVVSSAAGTAAALLHGGESGESIRIRRDGPAPVDPVLRRLHGAMTLIEDRCGQPQDVEWALRGDDLAFLQTRPITTLEPRRETPILWTRELSEERFPRPMSPLGWSVLQGVLVANLETLARRFGLIARRPNDVARTIRHYVYSNQQFFSIPGSLRPNPLAHLRFLPGYLLEGCKFLPLLFAASPLGVRLLGLSRLLRAAILPHAREIGRTWDAHLQTLIVEMDACDAVDPATLTTSQLLEHRLAIEAVARRYMEPDLAIYVVKMAAVYMVEQIGWRLRGRKDRSFLTDLTGGLSNNRTMRMSLELEALFDCFAADPPLIALVAAGRFDEALAGMSGEPAKALAHFIHLNGHLTTNWDLREPTWGEAPQVILGLLRGYALAGRRRHPLDVTAEQQRRQAAARQQVFARLGEGSWAGRFFDELLATLHDFMRIDEEHHFYASRLYRPLRRLYAELGRRLTASRVIEQPDDIYFLELEEIYGALDRPGFTRRYLVQARRASFERAGTARPPDRFLDQAPIAADGPADHRPEANVLRGVGASPGVAGGRVRVIETPDDIAAFVSGEVLVTPTPNPAWTPIYALAAALVTATGSTLSHGLVSAREYQLPAVIGIADVTRRLENGQHVIVDGDRGTVSIDV
ncbi:MAG: PEP/pyruvate-binding domain-containing protein [Acidobacteriota bacterium]